MKSERSLNNKGLVNYTEVNKCKYSNIRSMVNIVKRDEIEHQIRNNNLKIIGLTETCLNESISDAEINIKGFKTYRKDRVKGSKSHGGGVLLYVSEDLTSYLWEDASFIGSESIWVQIKIGDNEYLVVGVYYKRPDLEDDGIQKMHGIIKLVSNYNVVIMGDFNYPGIDWMNLSANATGSEFIDLTLDCFLCQYVTEPTRGDNCLDLIFASKNEIVSNVEVIDHLANSGHNTITFKINWSGTRKCNEVLRKQFCWAKGDYVQF